MADLAKKKRWMVVLSDDNLLWINAIIKETKSDGTKLKGTHIINAALERCRRDNSKFKAELSQAQAKVEWQKLNDKEMEIQEAKRKLSVKLKDTTLVLA